MFQGFYFIMKIFNFIKDKCESSYTTDKCDNTYETDKCCDTYVTDKCYMSYFDFLVIK